MPDIATDLNDQEIPGLAQPFPALISRINRPFTAYLYTGLHTLDKPLHQICWDLDSTSDPMPAGLALVAEDPRSAVVTGTPTGPTSAGKQVNLVFSATDMVTKEKQLVTIPFLVVR
jgi:hypothetical protein